MWFYNNKEFTNPSKEDFGFVYKITFPDNSFYIGCKQFYTIRNTKMSKKRVIAVYTGRGRKPSKEKLVKESNWKIYESSSALVTSMIQSLGSEVIFQILSIHKDKQSMILEEARLIINEFSLKSKLILNQWIKITFKKT